jgi:DNA polymerase gamma 1
MLEFACKCRAYASLNSANAFQRQNRRFVSGGLKIRSRSLQYLPTLQPLSENLQATVSMTIDSLHQETAGHTDTKVQVEHNDSKMQNNDPETPFNPALIQMLTPSLQKQVFAHSPKEPHPEQVKISLDHLHKHQLAQKKPPPGKPIDFSLPKLAGKGIDEHFYWIGAHVAEPWLTKAKRLTREKLPRMPKKWSDKPGWSRYAYDDTCKPVQYPDGDLVVFDVETMPADGPWPILAIAATPEAWYSWTSPRIAESVTFSELGSSQLAQSDKMIHFGHNELERIIVGHNVGYDRARIWEEYNLAGTRTRFLDTMSLHVACSGLSSQQRGAWLSQHKEKERRLEAGDAQEEDVPDWMRCSSMNALDHVSELYLGKKLDKLPRNILMTHDWSDIRDNFQALATYCAKDVFATYEVYQAVFPKYLQKCPHPASFGGILLMGSSYLTTDERWFRYIEKAEEAYRQRVENVETKLMYLAEKAIEHHLETESYREDPWLQHLDWTVPVSSRPARTPKSKQLEGMPVWYRDLWDPKIKRIRLTTTKRVAPYLLRLQWRGYNVYYSKAMGCWTFCVPRTDTFHNKAPPLTVSHDPTHKNHDPVIFADSKHVYYRIPHKDGDDSNVGNPLSKSYIQAFEDGVLTSQYPEAKEILRSNAECTYWLGNRQRIMDQFVLKTGQEHGFSQPAGVIIPQVIVMGTVTRRAVEKTWMTASNAKPNRIGSELKAQIAPPPGYAFVGADVDSQELWISSLIGDSRFGMHGATALGWMTLQGAKADGTDLHSRSAQILGIGRDNAKIFNYGRIYGAGVKYATSLLLQFNAEMTEEDARTKAVELFVKTKGLQQRSYKASQNPFGRTYYHGGTESFMFNMLERTAASEHPRTPALGCEIPDALTPKNVKTEYMTSRINWVVQSSGVDYLHLLLVSMDYIIKQFGIEARLLISIHDEVRFLVKESDKHRTALALQVANIWTRALFSSRLGIDDLPQSCAFFSAVDVDLCLRKEVDMTCVTPSNPEAVPSGEHFDVHETLKVTDGSLGTPEMYERGKEHVKRDLREIWIRLGMSPEEADEEMGQLEFKITHQETSIDEQVTADEDLFSGRITVPTSARQWTLQLVDDLGKRIQVPGPLKCSLHDKYWLLLQDAGSKEEVDAVLKKYKDDVVKRVEPFIQKKVKARL